MKACFSFMSREWENVSLRNYGAWKAYQGVDCTSFAVVLKCRPFLTRCIDKTRKFTTYIVRKKDLYHTWMIFGVVSWPWCLIFHSPPFGGNSHRFSHQCIYSHLKFFVFSLSFKCQQTMKPCSSHRTSIND